MSEANPRPAVGASRAAVWWLHPLLVAAFPVVFLFAANIREQLSLQPLWLPLGIVLGAAAATLSVAVGVGRVVGAGPGRAALAASLLILLSLTYGHAWNLVGEPAGMHSVLLVAWGALAIGGLVAIARLGSPGVRRLTTAVNVAAGILVAVNVVPIGELAVRTVSGEGPTTAGRGERGEAPPGATRDVWYLVFDRYAGSPALDELFGFDNGPFLDALRDRGFRVAEGATANYLKTAHSLASSLSMEELDADALAAEASAPDDWAPLYRRLQAGHAVERFLHERGYRYLHLGLRRGATYFNGAADVNFLLGDTTEFSAVLADTTILIALRQQLHEGLPPGSEMYAEQTLFQLSELERIADAPGLNFVFAHVLLPHPPYAFNADGSRTTPEQRASRTDAEEYLEQLRYANDRILGLLDRLQSGPPSSWPIVVLAADEGPFPERYARDEAGFAWLEATPEELLRKFSILTAVSVPGVDPAALDAAGFSDRITPVNLFRVAFNAAFDAGLPILPDRNWVFVDQRHLYDLVEVTERVRP